MAGVLVDVEGKKILTNGAFRLEVGDIQRWEKMPQIPMTDPWGVGIFTLHEWMIYVIECREIDQYPSYGRTKKVSPKLGGTVDGSEIPRQQATVWMFLKPSFEIYGRFQLPNSTGFSRRISGCHQRYQASWWFHIVLEFSPLFPWGR